MLIITYNERFRELFCGMSGFTSGCLQELGGATKDYVQSKEDWNRGLWNDLHLDDVACDNA